MVYRKGEMTDRHVDRLWPHQVRILVPGRGLPRIMEMERWIRRYGGHSRGEYDKSTYPKHFSRWCFTSAEVADDFQREFGGERVDTAERA